MDREIERASAIKEAVAVGYPREQMYGVWWAAAEPDVRAQRQIGGWPALPSAPDRASQPPFRPQVGVVGSSPPPEDHPGAHPFAGDRHPGPGLQAVPPDG